MRSIPITVILSHFPATKLQLIDRTKPCIIQMLTTMSLPDDAASAIHGTGPKTGDEQTGRCSI